MGKTSEMHIAIQDELMNIVHKAENGDILHIDAMIELRQHREQLERSLEIAKEYESANLEEIARQASEYPKGYKGYEIKSVSGRKSFVFKGIPEYEKAQSEVKSIEDKYKAAFEGFAKGTVQTVVEDGVRYWIDTDGVYQPFPEMNIGKSYLSIKSKNPNSIDVTV